MTTPCSHGMPTAASCIDCMANGNLAPAPPPAREIRQADAPRITARHDGECPLCDAAIHAGRDELTLTTHDRWVHACCPQPSTSTGE